MVTSVADPDDFLPDPDPDLHKFSANFFWEIFSVEICSKSTFMNQKEKLQRS
jgi:hypothetical protein